jgi:hypothetical protein
MQVLMLLKNAVSECAKVITFGSKLQGGARTKIVNDLQEICDKCDSAYSQVLSSLLPVKNSFGNTTLLAQSLRQFASDSKTRELFKPEKLCGNIDHLLDALNNNLDPAKYSIDVMRIRAVKNGLHMIGNYDGEIRRQFDEFTHALEKLSYKIEEAPAQEAKELASYAKDIIEDFQKELSSTVECMREVKREIIQS